MSRRGVAPLLLPLYALLLTTLSVNTSPLPNIDLADHVTDHKIEDAKTLFNETDTDQNGRVSFEEFSNAPDGSEVNFEYKELLFAYADVDRDGILSLDEFLHFFELLVADPSQNVKNQDLRRIVNANEWFKIYDTDHDGQISPKEAVAMVGQQHSDTKSLSKLATLALFDNADSDKDSRLKFMEFIIFITSVEDTLKKAEEVDSELPSANVSTTITTTEETATDYMEPVEGVTGSIGSPLSDSAELTDSQPKTAPPEWAPFIQTTTETPAALAEAVDKVVLPPLIADTSDELNITSVDAESSEEVVAVDPTTTASTPAEQKTAETKPFVAGGDFMKDPPAEAETPAAVETTTAMPSTERTDTDVTVAALDLDSVSLSDLSHESAVDDKQVDQEKTLTDDKLTSAEELELAATVSQKGETSTPADDSSALPTTTINSGNLPPSVAPVDVVEEAPSVEAEAPSNPAASMNKANLEMADQDDDELITMAEAFDFVRVFIKVNDYLMLESFFVQNDRDGDRKLDSDEYGAFLKALIDNCKQVTEDTCETIEYAIVAEPAPVNTSAMPVLIKEQSDELQKEADLPKTTPASSSAETPESRSSPAEPLQTDIPTLVVEHPQVSDSQSSEEDAEGALIAAMLKKVAEQSEHSSEEAEEDRPAAASTETENSPEVFVPVIMIEPPQEAPHAKVPSAEDVATLTALLVQQSSESKSNSKGSSSQSSEAADDDAETTTVLPEQFAENMEMLGFGGDVDTTTSATATTRTQAPPVMSEESEQNLIDDQKSVDVHVMRVNEGDFRYFARLHESALYLFVVALFLVLLIVVLAFVVARRVSSRKEKIYNVS